jgi:Ca-activated chloride channel family protein
MTVRPRLSVRLVGALALGVALPCAARALSWADLWQRPDQRAQALLDAGNAAAAAPLFDDPRRRGFAELRAQQFDAAAKQLQGLKDPESLYNRGNALAHAGDLKGALEAYDAALAALPKTGSLRQDAQHNRDLVAKQLESQPQQSKPGSGKPKDGDKNQSQKGDSQGDKDQPQDASNQSKPGDQHNQRDQQAQSGQQPPQQGGKPADQQAPQNAQSPGAQGQQAGQAGQPQNAKQGQPPGASPGKGPNQPQPGDPAKQDSAAAALADAQAGLQNRPPPSAQAAAEPAKPPPPAQSAQAKRDAKDARAADAASAVDDTLKPQTEQQLALEQWLRWIPDDPAGLLRRKFMIEHMLKQREEQQ